VDVDAGTRWKRLLESGRYGSFAELAAVEKIDAPASR